MVSRSELYRVADNMRAEMFITGSESLGDLIAAAHGSYGTIVRMEDFHSPRLCGITEPGDPDVILLNRFKPEPVNRFALAHELVHARLHRDMPHVFMPEDPLGSQDPVLEREADEGAAELLLPWREYLPIMRDFRHALGNNFYDMFCRRVCPSRRVSRSVACIRVRELWHPFEVYLKTGSLDAAAVALDDVPVAYARGLNYERIPIYRQA